jgi:hypothetical protein
VVFADEITSAKPANPSGASAVPAAAIPLSSRKLLARESVPESL